MTLIAGFFDGRCPIIMGDLLVSDTDKSERKFVFPTVGKVTKKHLSKGKYSPSRLCQKVNLISPKLAICCANKIIYANCFINEIIKANAHNNPSYELLLDIYNDIGGQGNLSIIGLYRDGTEMRIFDFESWPVDPPNSEFKYFKAAGSGYGTLIDTAPNLRMKITSGKPNKLEKGIAISLQIITSLLSKEIIDPLSLLELFGVGYEIVHPLGSDLSKFKDVTYVFWTVLEEKEGNWRMLPFPFLAFNYSYQGDILIIRSVKTSSTKHRNSCKIDSDYLHVVSPAYRTINIDELSGYSPASLNSKWICNVFLWKNVHDNMGAFSTFGNYDNQSPPIIWKNEFSQNEGVDINAEFLRSSVEKIVTLTTENYGK